MGNTFAAKSKGETLYDAAFQGNDKAVEQICNAILAAGTALEVEEVTLSWIIDHQIDTIPSAVERGSEVHGSPNRLDSAAGRVLRRSPTTEISWL